MLMDHLHMHAYKWRDIGYSLTFQDGELENISQTYPRFTPQQPLTVMLNQWVQWPTKDHRVYPTVEQLCEALRKDKVGLGCSKYHLNSASRNSPNTKLIRYYL